MFRKAHEKDLDAIVSIYNGIFKDEEAGILTTGWVRGIYPTRKTAEDAIRAGEMFLEVHQGEIVACGRINAKQEPEYAKAFWQYPAEDTEVLVLHTLAVSRQTAGKGFGTEFIAYYEKVAADAGAKTLRLDTNKRNRAARRLYKHLGYREAGIVQATFNGIPSVALVLLEKEVRLL
jgi:GNAT superfamily N-acetyltransferase